jgi:hypothetical protein
VLPWASTVAPVSPNAAARALSRSTVRCISAGSGVLPSVVSARYVAVVRPMAPGAAPRRGPVRGSATASSEENEEDEEDEEEQPATRGARTASAARTKAAGAVRCDRMRTV